VDIVSNVNLKELYNHHLQTNPLATLLVSKRETSRNLLFNKENNLSGWRNSATKKQERLNRFIPTSIHRSIPNMRLMEYM